MMHSQYQSLDKKVMKRKWQLNAARNLLIHDKDTMHHHDCYNQYVYVDQILLIASINIDIYAIIFYIVQLEIFFAYSIFEMDVCRRRKLKYPVSGIYLLNNH